MARTGFFISGTDTDVGKTFISVALLEAAARAGYTTLGLKPIASGAEMTPEGLRNADALQLQAASTLALDYAEVNPIALEPAVAPHIAAAWAGRRLSADRSAGFVRACLPRAQLTLVEGAGGWRVPLNGQETFADLAQLLQLPVIMVVPIKLGCINHALLTREAISRDGLPLAGWVANGVDLTQPGARESIDYLRGAMGCPCLGEVPWLPENARQLAPNYLDVHLLGL